MSDLLQRMLARVHGQISPIEPVLPSMYAPSDLAASAAVESVAEGERPVPLQPLPEDLPSDASQPKEIDARRRSAEPVHLRTPASNQPRKLRERFPVAKAAGSEHAAQRAEAVFQESVRTATVVPAPAVAERIVVAADTTTKTSAGDMRPSLSLNLRSAAAAPARLQERMRAVSLRSSHDPRPEGEVARTEVFVSIGHVEVRSAPVVQPAPKKAKQTVPLQEYLKRGREAAR
jgi:hypothetical protein